VGVVFSLFKWLFGKIFTVVLIVLAITTYFFLKNAAHHWIARQEARTTEAREAYEEARNRAGPQFTKVKDRADEVGREVNKHRRAISASARRLKELEGKWKGFKAFWLPGGYSKDDWFREKEKAEAAKRRAEKAKADAEKRLAVLNREVRSFQATLLNRDELREAEKDAEREQEELDDRKQFVADIEEDIDSAWQEGKDLIVTTIVIVLFGPFLWKLIGYWVIGGLATKLRYFQVREGPGSLPVAAQVGEGGPALQIPLQAKDTLVVKERFLQASKDEVTKKTQYVWNWHFPFLSILAGLIFLTRVRSTRENGGVTLSCDDDPAIEVIRVDLQEGEELVIRPGFLVGYLFTGKPLQIRTRWNFGLQSWMTLKFRNFLIEGEGAIFLAAGRGFSEEKINTSLIVDRDIPVLWNPALGFRARRAETFWSYALNHNSLFDDEFQGEGLVLCQQVRGFGGGRDAESIWSRFFTMIGKVFGL
jgi:uncharacterized protein (AIM24 family)